MQKLRYAFWIMTFTACLSGCQSLNHSTPKPATTHAGALKFNATGKIGVIQQTNEQNSAFSAFYQWGQDGHRFAATLTGALGLGAIHINYDGQVARAVVNNQTFEDENPSRLLYQFSRFYAPLELLAPWMMGQNNPDDTDVLFDASHRLIVAQNSGWMANFSYDKGALPNRLVLQNAQNHTKVTITINHI